MQRPPLPPGIPKPITATELRELRDKPGRMAREIVLRDLAIKTLIETGGFAK